MAPLLFPNLVGSALIGMWALIPHLPEATSGRSLPGAVYTWAHPGEEPGTSGLSAICIRELYAIRDAYGVTARSLGLFTARAERPSRKVSAMLTANTKMPLNSSIPEMERVFHAKEKMPL